MMTVVCGASSMEGGTRRRRRLRPFYRFCCPPAPPSKGEGDEGPERLAESGRWLNAQLTGGTTMSRALFSIAAVIVVGVGGMSLAHHDGHAKGGALVKVLS